MFTCYVGMLVFSKRIPNINLKFVENLMTFSLVKYQNSTHVIAS